MRMDGEIRVSTDRKYKSLYTELKNFAFGDMHELFFLCACVGYKHEEKKPLGRSAEDRFWSKTITPDEWAVFYSMMIESNDGDYASIEDDKKVVSLAEEYANAGIEIIIKNFLNNYVIQKGDSIKLDPRNKRELPKIFLNYIYQQTL